MTLRIQARRARWYFYPDNRGAAEDDSKSQPKRVSYSAISLRLGLRKAGKALRYRAKPTAPPSRCIRHCECGKFGNVVFL